MLGLGLRIHLESKQIVVCWTASCACSQSAITRS
uniref:Uncharacterized protein n=1 Tax=Arundo donax TaxID=35708 RepID=A0A0A9SA31_ARUDO